MASEKDKTIAVVGPKRTIAFAVRANGSMPAKEFYESLDESQKRQVAVLFERMANEGVIRNREQFKKVRGEIFEFKRFQIRIGCFPVGRTWVLTHGFIKKSDDWKQAELDRANSIRCEHLEWKARQK